MHIWKSPSDNSEKGADKLAAALSVDCQSALHLRQGVDGDEHTVPPAALHGAPVDVRATVVPCGISVSLSPHLSTGGRPIHTYITLIDGMLKGTTATVSPSTLPADGATPVQYI